VRAETAESVGRAESLSVAGKLGLAVEIASLYAQVRARVGHQELEQVVAWLRRARGRRSGQLRNGLIHRRRLAAAVARTLDVLPVADSSCLMRSLVLLGILARRDLATTLVIAVREPTRTVPVDAHAWIEHAGEPLLWPGDDTYWRVVTL
jgi:hypothetical protein